MRSKHEFGPGIEHPKGARNRIRQRVRRGQVRDETVHHSLFQQQGKGADGRGGQERFRKDRNFRSRIAAVKQEGRRNPRPRTAEAQLRDC